MVKTMKEKKWNNINGCFRVVTICLSYTYWRTVITSYAKEKWLPIDIGK